MRNHQRVKSYEEFRLIPWEEEPSQWAPTMGQQTNKIIKRRRRADYLKRKSAQAKLGGIAKKPTVKKEAVAKKAPAKKAVAKKAPAKKAAKKVASKVAKTVDEEVAAEAVVEETVADAVVEEAVVETVAETAPEVPAAEVAVPEAAEAPVS